MLDCLSIIQRYYTPGNEDYRVLVIHSRQVADMAVAIAQRLIDRHEPVDIEFVEEAAMLHDIGIFRCDAPGIACHGTEPYICHGRLGAELMREEGYPKHARVCERHTGAGLTKEEIVRQNLPLPHQDFLPETLEEKLICYADKFYSKSNLKKVKTPEQAAKSLAKFGEDGLQRFLQWKTLFEPER